VALAHVLAAVTWGVLYDRWGPSTTTEVFMVGLVVAFLVGIALLRPGRDRSDRPAEVGA